MAGFDFSTLFGDELASKAGGASATGAALKDKEVVGIYFSAHWCPPCRSFTPQLGQFYEKHKAAKKLEIVFVSSDNDEASFESYFAEQAGWLAVPFVKRDVKAALSKAFKVNGIPTLVLLDGATGDLITAEARGEVSGDPEASRFPWRPRSFDEILASLPPLATKGGQGATVTVADIEAPLLFYFSAHWCPPCRSFTPDLVAFSKKVPAGAKVVFVSSDRDEAAFDEYYASMGDDWLALPFADRDAKAALSKLFAVTGIPSLVLVSAPDAKNGGARAVINANARSLVAEDLVAGFPESWKPRPYADLAKGVDCGGSDVNETRSVVVLCDGQDKGGGPAATAAVAALKGAAEAHAASDKDAALFFFATDTAGPVAQVRKLCGLPATAPGAVSLLLLDIPDDGAYYTAALQDGAALTSAAIAAFLDNPGARMQLA